MENASTAATNRYGPLRGLAALLLGLSISAVEDATPASAQALNAGQGALPSQQVATPAVSSEPPLPAPEALLPDPFGVKRWLADHGIAVLLDDINELSGNISGGGGPPPSNTQTTGGASLAGQVGLETDIN